MLISSPNTLRETPRIRFAQTFGLSIAQSSWHIELIITVDIKGAAEITVIWKRLQAEVDDLDTHTQGDVQLAKAPAEC